MDDFWARERKSKLTRPVDLSTIAYLNIPIDKFAFGTLTDPESKKIEEEIILLSKKPLLNLTGKTNTELREEYGSPNLETMKAIGDDFDTLTLLLCKYAQALFDSGHINEAIPVLEYGVYVKSDVSTTYTLLADCFYERNQKRRLDTLREEVAKLDLLMRASILKYIDEKTSTLSSSENESIPL